MMPAEMGLLCEVQFSTFQKICFPEIKYTFNAYSIEDDFQIFND